MKPGIYKALASTPPKGNGKYNADIKKSAAPNGLGSSNGRPAGDGMTLIQKAISVKKFNNAIPVSAF